MQDATEDVNEDLSYNGNIESVPKVLPLPEECNVPFDQQIANIKAAYSDEAFRECPLLPPYTLDEVCAMEIKYSFSFPPLLRFYMLNISRETSFTSIRSLIQPVDQAFEETWLHHTAYSRTCKETICFSGRLCGFVQIDYYNDRMIVRTVVRTLYECLTRADSHIYHKRCQCQWCALDHSGEQAGLDCFVLPTLEETLQKFRDLGDLDFSTAASAFKDDVCDKLPAGTNFGFFDEIVSEVKRRLIEIQNVDFPNELRVCRREPDEAMRIILGHARIRRMVEELNGKARVIQRRYRLWKWRKDILWNPHTDIGRLNLLMRARLSHVACV